MPLIKLTDNSFLREHPFLDPISQPSPVQKHSFIFPGDELMLYHRIQLPYDTIGAATSINQINIKSARVSLIAIRPQVYSEEYSLQYLSSHSFTLDSFVTQFNNGNAPNIPWGISGADGFAQSLNVLLDRNFRLPSGDFRRQIKFFTTHTNTTSQWEYYFYFPVLFRWEYWIALLNASNYFYDATQPQNNLNQLWYHYFNSNWKIRSRLELSITINGVPTIIRTDLNLTPNASHDVEYYNANTDYNTKSIKTSVVHGTPSNSPCLIKRNENTEVFGYFTKASAWTAGEQGNISAVVWIEPFEGAGRDARTRASSLYPISPESVFAGLGLSLTDDSDIGITTGTGDYIIVDGSSNGAIVYFDGAHPDRIIVFALIDYLKLNAIYPGVNKFTLYVRLYNKTIDFVTSRKGECLKQDATVVTIPVSNTLCEMKKPQCAFNLNVFADDTGIELQNDKSAFYEYGDDRISTIAFTLQKNSAASCGVDSWVDKATISSNIYGRFFAYGLSPDFYGTSFVDDYGKKYTGLFLEWSKVLAAFGVGFYRMKIVKTDIFSTAVTSYDDRTFCLKTYNCNLINRTVRIETLNQGLRGSLKDQNVQIDYSSGWRDEIRLKGVFRFRTSNYTKEYNQYGDTDFNALRPITNEQGPKYLLQLRPVPGWMDFILSTEVLQADEILITDYNTSNRHSTFVKIPVMNDGELTPADNNLANPLSSIEINLAYGRNNLRKRNS